MRSSAFLALLLSTALWLPACQREAARNPEAEVEAAIRDYLETRPGLSLDNMEMELTKVEFQGDTAEADVLFRSKAGEGEMPFHYTLRREGDGWVVERRGRGQMPPGHPPVTEPQEAPETLPRTGRE